MNRFFDAMVRGAGVVVGMVVGTKLIDIVTDRCKKNDVKNGSSEKIES